MSENMSATCRRLVADMSRVAKFGLSKRHFKIQHSQLSESGRSATCKNVIYIADSYIENPTDNFTKWVQNQTVVLFIEKDDKNIYHYQLVLNDDVAQHFTPLPSKHKGKTTVSPKKLRASFKAYSSNFSHEIKFFSTYPYVAKDTGNSIESCLQFMHIISKLSLVFGNSHEFGKKRQLVSNSCLLVYT
jgi:hypothetical protein